MNDDCDNDDIDDYCLHRLEQVRETVIKKYLSDLIKIEKCNKIVTMLQLNNSTDTK